VALAAKLARIAWAVLRQGRNFDHQVCRLSVVECIETLSGAV
jgi:hypothetical protein